MRNLSKRKVASYSHQLSKSVPYTKISESDLRLLVGRLRAGDKSVRDQIILGHVHLAMSAAGKFMFTHMRKKNDIVAAAMLGLVQAVTWAETRLYDDEITPYIYETVCRHIQDFLEEDWVITMPGSTHRLSVRTADKENDPNLIVKPPRTITLPNDEGNTNIYRRLSTHAVSETAEAMVFEDFCLHSHLTDVEKAVLHLLLESYTIDEMVGKVIGERGKPVSRIRIYQIVDGIKNKVHLER